MIAYYLDSSAWLKRYYLEAGSLWMNALFQTDLLLVCATVGLIEVYATFARKHKAGQVTSESLEQFTEEVELDWDRFGRIKLDNAVLAQAKLSTQKFALRGADAIHLGSALVFQAGLSAEQDRFIFVTSDQELKKVAQEAGFETFDPATTETP